mmetsp:Transcript_5303/g.15836  ORF Transcript_5303/g.15836 Transcript_5303/m.15836 type:complete len:301 (+) Transcript_5303:237-1139(+)
MQTPARKPKRVGDIILGNVLGEGSNGLVREGLMVDGRKVVAVKCIKRRLLSQRPNSEQRLRQEIAALRKLPEHPGFIRLVDVLDNSAYGSVYLATELVNGVQLKEILERTESKRLPPNKTLREIFRKLFEALYALHSAGIAHRDVAPDNILITVDLGVKLVDFGNASIVESNEKTAAGTLGFQAPEVARREKTVDLYKADIWSAGAVLYLCVCGRMPFVSDSLMDVLRLISRGEVEYPADVDAETSSFLRTVLNASPSARPSSEELLRSLWFKGGEENEVTNINVPPKTITIASVAEQFL